jgi:hypothetical protein
VLPWGRSDTITVALHYLSPLEYPRFAALAAQEAREHGLEVAQTLYLPVGIHRRKPVEEVVPIARAVVVPAEEDAAKALGRALRDAFPGCELWPEINCP